VTRPNRVAPTGDLAALPQRGLLMGNRGILHDEAGRLGSARWRHRNWIACVLSFRGGRRTLMAPGRYTELFFLDEAVALAAGHRPCAECRRADWLRFMDAWEAAHGERPRAAALDRQLHAARVRRDRSQVRHAAPWEVLPDGAFALDAGEPCLTLGDRVVPFGPEGYGRARPRPEGEAEVLTPAPLVAVLAAGYRPLLHPAALDAAGATPSLGGSEGGPT
jgi:hypothetical protein